MNVPIIVALNHGNPWLKDKHILNNLSYEDAVEEVRKFIEVAIKVGCYVIHVDTTVDSNIDKPPELDAKRIPNLIEFSEEVREAYGLRPLNHEVVSWILMTLGNYSLVLRGIKDRVLMRSSGDTGTGILMSGTSLS